MLFSTRRTRTTLIGHAVATRAATDVILRVRAGLAEPSRPISAMLFTGPTGTGADLPFTANAVRWVCYGHAIISYDARRRAAGRLTAAQIAPLLGISVNARGKTRDLAHAGWTSCREVAERSPVNRYVRSFRVASETRQSG